MEVGVVSTIISTAGAIGVAIIGYHQRRNNAANTKRQSELDAREELRSEGCMLQMEMLQAQLKLGKVTAKAVLNQKTNGDVEEAMHWAHDVEIKYADYLRRAAQF